MSPANLVFVNGNVLTLDGNHPHAQAVAISNGRIAAVGADASMREFIGPGTEVVDLRGKTLLPGFNDSHLHLYVLGQYLTWVILAGAGSLTEMLDRVREKAARTPSGQVILGRGWDQTLFRENRFPNRHDLDAAAPDNPVALTRICGHAVAVNSRALELAGITKDTPDPVGGRIGRDPATGEPTGLLWETAKLLFTEKAPQPTAAERKAMVKTAINKAVSCGLTSVTTDDIRPNLMTSIADCRRIYREIWAEGGPVLRVNLLVYQSAIDELLSLGLKTRDGDEQVRIGAMKLVQDGSLGARSGVLRTPYTNDPGNCGLPVHSNAELTELILKGHNAGMQVAIHVIGDAAIDACLDAFERGQALNPRPEARHRLIHYCIVDETILRRTKELGVGVDIQPRFITLNGKRVLEFLGPERARLTYPWKTVLAWGIPAAGGSDSPVDRLEPLQGIHNAVNRQVDSVPGMVFQPEEKLSVPEALHLYTTGSAYSTFEEDIKGTITPGKLADFVVLADDPCRVPPETIRDLPVEITVVGGRIVYTAD